MMGEGETSLYLNSVEDIKNYFKSYCYKRKIETFLVVYLTTSCRVINAEIMFEGSIGEVAVYVREIVKHAVLHNAHSVIVGHNHPGGFLHPSTADVQMTDKIRSALSAVDIKLKDHILCSGGQAMSFKQEGLLNRGQ